MQRRGHDLAGARAEAAGEHHQRSVVGDAVIAVLVDLDAAVVVADLDDRARLDEEAGEVDGLFERAAAVAAQVEDDALSTLGGELFEQLRDVAGGRLARPALAADGEVGVEAGQIDHTDALGLAVVGGQLDQLPLGLGILELDLVADDRDDFADGGIGAGRDDREADLATFFAADLADDLGELLVDHVHELALALRDGDHLVADLDLLALLGGGPGPDLLDHGVAVLGLERGADAEEAEVHAHRELIQLAFAEVIGVRVVGVTERIEPELEHLVGLELLQVPQRPLVAAGQFLDDLVVLVRGEADLDLRHRGLGALLRLAFGRLEAGLGELREIRGLLRAELVGERCGEAVERPGQEVRPEQFAERLGVAFVQLLGQVLEPQAVLPELLRLLEVLGPGGVLAVDQVRLLGGIERELAGLQLVDDERVRLIEAREEAVEDVVGRGRVSLAEGQIVQGGTDRCELVDVGLEEIQLLRIERVDVAVEHLLADFPVELVPGVMHALQEPGDRLGDAAVIGAGLEIERVGVLRGDREDIGPRCVGRDRRLAGSDGLGRWRLCGPEQRGDQKEQRKQPESHAERICNVRTETPAGTCRSNHRPRAGMADPDSTEQGAHDIDVTV